MQRPTSAVHSNEVMMSQERGGTKWGIQARDRPANFQAIHRATQLRICSATLTNEQPLLEIKLANRWGQKINGLMGVHNFIYVSLGATWDII